MNDILGHWASYFAGTVARCKAYGKCTC